MSRVRPRRRAVAGGELRTNREPDPDALDRIEGVGTAARAVDARELSVIGEVPEGVAVEFKASEPPVLVTVALQGGAVESAVVETGDDRLTAPGPPAPMSTGPSRCWSPSIPA